MKSVFGGVPPSVADGTAATVTESAAATIGLTSMLLATTFNS
jgi:hypothetical protein